MMSLRPAILCALAACHGEGGEDRSGEAFGVGLATHCLLGADQLWLFQVRESEQGGVDRNGDGDAFDELVFVLDLRRGVSPLALIDPGLSVGLEGGAPGLLACDGQAAAIAVDEAAQGGLDLNADGDAEDRILFVFDRARGVFTNQELAVRAIEVGGPLVACAVDERAHGMADLDGDGDTTDSVLAVHDLRDGSTMQFALRDSAPLLVRDEYVALRLAERLGLDLNLDGDDQDTVFEVYDGRTRLLQNTTLVLASPSVAFAGGAFGLSVSEAGQGQGDLSGDGDEDDSAFHVYDPRRGFSINLGLTVPLGPAPVTDGRRFLLFVREGPGAVDANQDGDRDDVVVQVFDAESGLLLNTGLASQGAAVLAGEWVGVSVSEPMHGSLDLNGDGELSGDIVHVHELASGLQQNLGLDAFVLHGSLGRVFLAPFEAVAQVDWNQDGDRLDRVLFDWSSADGLLHQGFAVASVWTVLGDDVLVSVAESGDGRDRNGDGDALDLILELHEGSAGSIRPLGLAAGSAAALTPAGVLALVEEEAQGRDLNGDGDRADEVLHVVPR